MPRTSMEEQCYMICATTHTWKHVISNCNHFFNIANICRLISAGADVNTQDKNGYYPLFSMIYLKKQTYDDTERTVAVAALLKAGANPNLKTNAGLTMLGMHKKNVQGNVGKSVKDQKRSRAHDRFNILEKVAQNKKIQLEE